MLRKRVKIRLVFDKLRGLFVLPCDILYMSDDLGFLQKCRFVVFAEWLLSDFELAHNYCVIEFLLL